MSAFFEQGFSVREPMWHGMGEVLDEYPGREKAMEIAGHNFSVIERPIAVVGKEFQPLGPDAVEMPSDYLGAKDDEEYHYFGVRKAEGWKALVKNTDGTILNVTRESYGVVQNDTLWDIVDAIVNQPNVHYETAGVLKGGAVLWVLAWLDEPTVIPGDDSPIYPFVMASTTHDGSGAAQARATSVRVVCWNTFSGAEAEAKRTGLQYTFRHTKNVNARIEDAKMALKGVRQAHEEFIALAEELAGTPVTVAQRDLFVAQFIPMPPESLVSDTVVRNVESARQAIRNIIDGNTIPEAHKLTGYGLLQAGTEYLDHIRGFRSRDTYLGRSLLRNEPAKSKIATLVREVAAA